MSAGWRARLSAAALAGLTALTPCGAGGAGDDPTLEVAEAIRTLGPPGMLWGRISVEEESPAGESTPLRGVEVTLYPATPTLQRELERVRQSARSSGDQFESAVARVRAALAAHQARIDAQSAGTPLARPTAPVAPAPAPAPPPERKASPAPPPSRTRRGLFGRAPVPPKATPGKTAVTEEPAAAPHPFQQATDHAGLFAFDEVPSGEWVVVGIRIAPYSGERLRAPSKPRAQSPTERFLPRSTGGTAKEAEVWVVRVRVQAGERTVLDLTDRARWLVGPVR